MFGRNETIVQELKRTASKLDQLIASQRRQREESRAEAEEFRAHCAEFWARIEDTEALREELRAHAGRTETTLDEVQVSLAEFREFNREILLRNEKVYLSVIARLEKLGEETEANTEATRAHTSALLQLLDRFDNRG